MRRFEQTFARLAQENRKGLVTYIMAGDGGMGATSDLLHRLPDAGADIIELGMPFTDPMADGPTIQKAAIRALGGGTNLTQVLAAAAEFRKRNQTTPLVLMGYYNPIFIYGEEAFINSASQAGVDGLIIVDLPPEEDGSLRAKADAAGISMIRLTTPTTNDHRLEKVLEGASGFIYHVSVKGITGGAQASTDQVATDMDRIRAHTKLPLAIGFGISNGAQAKEMAAHAHAVVVGSALVRYMEVDETADPDLDGLIGHVRSIREALDE